MKKHFLINYYLTIIFAGVFMFASCKADVDLGNVSTEMELNLGLALPLGTVRATMGDFIGDTTIKYLNINENGIYELSYSDTFAVDYHTVVFTENTNIANEDFKLSEQIAGSPIELQAGQTYTLEFPMNLNLMDINKDPENYERIDSVVITQALFTSNFSLMGDLDIQYGDELEKVQIILPEHNFRNLDKNLFPDNTVDVALNKRFGADHPIEIPRFTLNLLKTDKLSDGVDDNITVTCRLVITPKRDRTITNLEAGFAYTFKVNLIDYSVIYGWFCPNDDLATTDTLFVAKEMGEDLFNRFKDTRLPFKNPYIQLKNRTNVGIPVEWRLYDVKTFSSDGDVVSINFQNGMLSWPITICPASPYELKETVNTIDTDDGDINELFAFLPEKLCFSRDLLFFSTGTGKNTQYFLPKDAVFELSATVVLPLDFDPDLYITYSDTIENINISDSILEANNMSLDNVQLKLVVKNGLPFEISGSFLFLDEAGKDLEMKVVQTETGSSDKFVFAAGTTQNGIVTEPSRNVLSVVVTGAELDKLYKLKNIVYTAELGKNTGAATLTPENYLSVQVGLSAQAGVTLNSQSNQ